MTNFNTLLETDGLVHTLNNMGYMTKKLDPYSKQFINYCKTLTSEDKVLEVGAAFGVATLQILSTKVNVVCNDLDTRHLQYIFNIADSKQRERLSLVPGRLPEDLNFVKGEFSGILACRIIHLITGEDIEKAMGKFYEWLKPGGKLYIVADTPYLKPFKKFLPYYKKNKELGMDWPGFIEDSSPYKQDGLSNIPKFINFLDKEVLIRIFNKSNFSIVKCSYIDRCDFAFLKAQGKESVGIIGEKPL